MTTRTVSTQADLDAALGMCKLHSARGASDLAEMLGLTGGRVVAS